MPIWESIIGLFTARNPREWKFDQPTASMTLHEYLRLVSAVPLPSTQQKTEFAEFVSTAHSWYKHLPRNVPGQPFYFFVDKFAGCDRQQSRDGRGSIVERTKQGFHYSALPTAEYRNRFGYLTFESSAGTYVFVTTEPHVYARDAISAVLGNDGKLYRPPKEILEISETRLTAILHPLASCYWVCNSLTNWPEESGGQIALEKIHARCREMQDPTNPEWKMMTRRVGYADPILENLTAAERRRQKHEIVRSIDRVCELISQARDNRLVV